MPEYVLNRNYALRSTFGRVINFVKGEPVWVPPMCVKEALAIGAEPAEGDKPDMTGEVEAVPQLQYTPDERRDLINAAFEELIKINRREDFTAQGSPSKAAVEKIVGFEVPNKERNDLWFKYKEAKATAEAE